MARKENTDDIYITALSVIPDVETVDRRSGEKIPRKIFCEYENCCEEESRAGKVIPGIFSSEPSIRLFIRNKLREGIKPAKYVLLSSEECYKKKKFGLAETKAALLEAESKDGYHEIIETIEKIRNIKGLGIDEDFTFTTFEYVQAVIFYEMKKQDNSSALCADDDALREYVIQSTTFENGEICGRGPIVVYDSRDVNEVKEGLEQGLKEYGGIGIGRRADQLIELTVDVTGGTRLTSFMTILLAQWFETHQSAVIKKMYYASRTDRTADGLEFKIVNWIENYRKFGIKDFNISRLSENFDQENIGWLEAFVDYNVDRDKILPSGEVERLKDKVAALREDAEKADFSMDKVWAVYLCQKAAAKLSIIDKCSIQKYVQDAMGRPYVFISYSHKDYDKVYDDIGKLKNEGVNFVYDIILELYAGSAWDKKVRDYILNPNCKGVIFYFSENSIISDSVFQEVEMVQKISKKYFAVNLDRTVVKKGDAAFIRLPEEVIEACTENITPHNKETLKKMFANRITAIPYYNNHLEPDDGHIGVIGSNCKDILEEAVRI